VDRLQVGDPSQVGSFRLLGRLGEGGLGRVFLGASPDGRKVAIKVVHPRHADDPDFRRRLAREVTAAREVDGFHSAAVMAADPGADPPWIATPYIPGPSLADAIAQRGSLDEAGVRQLGAALAEGLAAIHACGLIHRDLKPGNVILADDGPRIIYFGIATDMDAAALTAPDAVISTIRCMSPEQLNARELTPRSDVFAVGVVLAYAATGRYPFGAPAVPAAIHQILNDPPDLGPLSGELRNLIADCLAKDPGDRPGPRDVLARLGHLAEGQQPPTAQPADAAAAARGPRRQRPRRRRRLRRAGLIAAAGVTMAVSAVAVATLGQHPARTYSGAPWCPSSSSPAPPARPATSPSAVGSLPRTIADPTRSVAAMAFAPGGSTLATGDDVNGCFGYVYLWNATTGANTARLTEPAGHGVCSVAFAPDGGTLAVGDNNGSTYLWDTATGTVRATLTDPASVMALSVAFAPDGTTLAVGDDNGNTYLWNTTTGAEIKTLASPDLNAIVDWVAFAPDGITLATGDSGVGGDTWLWNTTTGKLITTLTEPGPDPVVTSVAFAPDGTTLATSDVNGHAYLWNTATGTLTATLTDPGRDAEVTSVAFAPDGTTLATGDVNGHAYLWDTTTGTLIKTLTEPGRDPGVFSVVFAPNGTTLATGGGDGDIYLWNITRHTA
jgi:WD40 repeat protein